jgi:hypothetical protein
MGMKLSKPDLFEALNYEPHPGQVLVHRSNAPRRVLACGVRWGKSTCAVMEAAAALLQPREECLGWTVAPTLDLARLVFERTAALLLRKFKHRVKFYSQREQRLVVVNFGGGLSVLEGKTADHPTSLLGESLDFLIVDEVARMRESVWSEHLSQRLIDRRGWALFLSTPRGRDFFWKLFRRGQKGRDKDFESWSSPSWENPLLDRTLIDDERGRLTEEAFAAQYEGQFTGEDPDPCDVCHGPSPDVPGIFLLWDDMKLGRCAECGHSVDANGRTIVKRHSNGSASVMVMEMRRRRGEQPTVHLAKTTTDQRGPLLTAPDGPALEVDV